MQMSDKVRVIAFAKDKWREHFFRVLKFTNIDGVECTALLPIRASTDAILDLLGRHGYKTPIVSSSKAALLRDIEGQNPKRVDPATAQIGWHDTDNGCFFVHPSRNFGPTTQKFYFEPESPARFAKYRQAGTLSSWQENVAALATGNSLTMFATMAAFAGPLMRLLNIETGGFQIVADSSTGKSTSLIVGGSVWGGGGASGFVETWLLTANALDLLAAAHCDGFLLLDEAGLASQSKPSDAANLILNAVYRLTSEEEKIRFTDVGPGGTWRLLFIGTSELTLDQLAVQAGQPVKPGQRVRFPDIVFNGGKGMGVFEELHSAATPQQFAEMLKDAALQHYGTPGIAFLKKLTKELGEDPDGLKTWLECRMEFYRKKAGISGWDGPQARVARRFALVYAAGCLAQEYGILPWGRNDMAAAVHRCHKCVPSELYHPPLSGAEHVAEHIRANRTRFIDLETFAGAMTKKEVLEAPGLIYTRQNGQREYLFSSQQFREIVCAGVTAKSVIADLKSKGLINLHNSGKSTVQRAIPGLDPERVVSIQDRIMDVIGKGSQPSNQRKHK
jgi:hypothetical protein